jgi:Fur family zinc uptake transcriptional regulator
VLPRIYRALDFLVERGLIHQVECLNVFIPCTGGHHRPSVPFLICRHCGSVAEIEDGAVSQARERAANRNGFHPGDAMIELDGMLATCAHQA